MIRFPVQSESSHSPDVATPSDAGRLESKWLGISADRLRKLGANAATPRVLVLVAIVEAALILRLFRLEDLPGELFGDFIVHYQLASQIMHGHLFLNYQYGGDGPMYAYATAAMSFLFGLSFYTLKLTGALIGAIVVVATFYLSRELFDRDDIAWVASFLSAVSFWTITQSRIGGPRILVPLFVALCVLFSLRKKALLAGICLGLGMYTQASFWGTPLVFLANIPALIIGGIVSLPVLFDFVHNYSAYFGSSSYIGEKLGPGHLSIPDLFMRVIQNGWANLLSFNVRGDNTFRVNIVGHPTLDRISGIFLIVGAALLIYKVIRERDRRLILWLVLPFFEIQLPSVLDTHPQNVPSMGRMLGIAPFVYIIVAYGVCEVARAIKSSARADILSHRASRVFLAVVLASISVINFNNYFVVYPAGLPNGNTPFGRIIARRVDTYPSGVPVFVIGCCWGEWSQPEPNGIQYTLQRPRNIVFASDASKVVDAVGGSTAHSHPERIVVVSDPGKGPQSTTGIPFERPPRVSLLRQNRWNVAWITDGYVKVR